MRMIGGTAALNLRIPGVQRVNLRLVVGVLHAGDQFRELDEPAVLTAEDGVDGVALIEGELLQQLPRYGP
eukprot:14750994-Heterocapsa_arctica.AAC.1